MRSPSKQGSKKTDVGLWIVQAVLAALFLFAGGMKLVMPAETLTQGTTLSAGFLRFIGVAEMLGALGLVLPGLFQIRTILTPLAAGGLVSIMVGATIITAASMGVSAAVLPAVVGILAASVAYGRARVAPHPERSRPGVLPTR
jgi:hypothetical protein